MRHHRGAAAALLLALASCGIGDNESQSVADCKRHGPDEVLPDEYEGTMKVIPDQVRPGAQFRVEFPSAAERTETLTLHSSCRSYVLTHDAGGYHWEDITGADRFASLGEPGVRDKVTGVVPETAQQGVYQLCDAAQDVACVLIEVLPNQ